MRRQCRLIAGSQRADVAGFLERDTDRAAFFLTRSAAGAETEVQLIIDGFHAFRGGGDLFDRGFNFLVRRPAFERDDAARAANVDVLHLTFISDLHFLVNLLHDRDIVRRRADGLCRRARAGKQD